MLNPKDEEELAAMVAEAAGPLRIRGGGTRDIGRPVVGELLSTRGLSGVTLYEPGALTLVVRAGTPLAEVEAVLGAERQRLAFEPMDHRALLGTEGVPTIGSVAAANVSGPRRVQVGAARDHLIGVRFVDGNGKVIRNGGRVMKNVTGYDLVKLLAGSWGTLGVLTELSFKLQAIPEAEATLVLSGRDPTGAVAAMSQALGSPYDVSGAAHIVGGETLIRVEGMAGSVAYRAGALQALHGGDIVSGTESANRWLAVRDVRPFAGMAGAVWKVSVRPGDGPALLSAVAALEPAAIMDWGGGLVWLLVPEGDDAGAATIRAATERLGGHATLIRASSAIRALIPAFHPQPAPLAAIERGLRATFDPRGVLNSGIMD